MFAAGVSGGIWKSDDNGITWRLSSTGLLNIAVNAMAIDPQEPRVMFAGTGEGYFREEIRGTGLPLRGGGVFISRDGGTAWQRLPATNSADFYWVNDLELGVGDSRIVYAATRTGVWRSRNRGDSWERVLTTSAALRSIVAVRRIWCVEFAAVFAAIECWCPIPHAAHETSDHTHERGDNDRETMAPSHLLLRRVSRASLTA